MAKKVLLTGASGYVGQALIERLLRTTDDRLVLWLHARTREEAEAKTALLSPSVAAHRDRVEFAWGELGADQPFAGVSPRDIGAIVHSAAITRFNVAEADAQRVNVEGSRKLFQLASQCPSLDNLVFVSTAYASGLRGGVIPETRLSGEAGFANHYERSKWQAEELLATDFGHLPYAILRVATILCDDESGTVTQKNAVHNTLKLLFYGLLSLVPGHKDTPLYFVTGDFVARVLGEWLHHPRPGQIAHVCHSRAEAVLLDEMVTIAFDVFGADEQFRVRRVLKPLYTDAESFDLLAEGIDSFGGDAFRQALGSVAPFARQLFVKKELSTDALSSLRSGGEPQGVHRLVRRTCESLVKTRWGRA
jgi:nucleoside-diphosphate-sugar epimerase